MKLLPRMIVSFGLLVGFTGSLVATSPAMAQIDDDAKARAERRKKRLEGDDADKKDERKAPAQIGAKQRGKNMTERADKLRDETIKKTEALLGTLPKKDPREPILKFRLAEKFWQKSRYLYIKSMDELSVKMDKWYEAGGEGKQPDVKQSADYASFTKFEDKALKLYREILKRFPKFERNDEIFYNLGSALYQAGKKKQGIRMYVKLIKRYPKSQYGPDAYLQIGEHYFNDAGKLSQAIKAYAKAYKLGKKVDDARIYTYAYYKLAWCDYNTGDYAKALKKFRKVVGFAKETKKVQLRDEALNDMIRAYSHLDAVDDAFEYYKTEVSEKEAYEKLRRLGALYDKEGKYDVEIKLFKKLNELYPYHPKAPVNQSAIMNAWAQLDSKEDVRREANTLVDLYSPDGPWAKRNADNQRAVEQANEIVEDELSGLVTEQHKEAQQTKLVETYKLARDLYKKYLSRFSDSDNAYKFRFFYAEILFDLKEFGDAAPVYDYLASLDEGEFRKVSSYNAILSWEKVLSGVKEELGKRLGSKKSRARGQLKQLEKLKTLKKGGTYEPIPLTDTELKLSAACDRYAVVAPEDPQTVKVKFKSAQLYYLKNHFADAAVRFNEIIENYPTEKMARLSAELIVESFNVRKDWVNLNKYSRLFQENGNLMKDKEFAERIGDYVEFASVKEIFEIYEKKESELQIADRYIAYSKEFPKGKYAMLAAYNAFNKLDAVNELDRSMKQASVLLNDFKDFKLSKKDAEANKKDKLGIPEPVVIREKVLFRYAEYYARLALFDEAAGYFASYASEFKKDKKFSKNEEVQKRISDATLNAASLYQGIGEHNKAISLIEAYLKMNPKAEDTAQQRWRIGEIIEKKEDWSNVVKYFGKLERDLKKAKADERAVCALYRQTKAYLKMDRERDARKTFSGIEKGWEALSSDDKSKPCVLEARAYVEFTKVEDEFKDYEAIDFNTTNQNKLLKAVEKKQSLIEELAAKYKAVIDLKHPEYAIASAYRIAIVSKLMADAFLNSPCPKQLTDDQCGMYQAALQEQAFPHEDAAIQLFDEVLQQAYGAKFYNEWLVKAQDALKAYEPHRFPAIQTYGLVASEPTKQSPRLAETYQ